MRYIVLILLLVGCGRTNSNSEEEVTLQHYRRAVKSMDFMCRVQFVDSYLAQIKEDLSKIKEIKK